MTASMDPAHIDGRVVEVVAAVIRDARGRVLLTRRTEGRDLAGLWEFPGGKREHGESPEHALQRELHEELGIDVEVGSALINVPQQYPDKRLRLDVRCIDHWRGTARGREGQALVWAPPTLLARYAMPPADRPVVAALLQPDHLLVTPSPGDDDAQWLDSLSRALADGVRRVQLRARGLDAARWRALARKANGLAARAGATLLVNGDVALAGELGVGLHLRSDQLHEMRVRPIDATQVLSAACHTAKDLAQAQALGCDFALLGPVLPTHTHPGAPVLGWDGFSHLRETCSLPIYALGGLSPQDIPLARANGAQGIAAITSLWPQSP